MIRQNRMIIQQMDNEATVDIETENLKCYVILENVMVSRQDIRCWRW